MEQLNGVDIQYLVEMVGQNTSCITGKYGSIQKAKEMGMVAREAAGRKYEVNIYIIQPMLYTFTEHGKFDTDLEEKE